ncbi:unnamed protein product [Acanthosepion pharaonis]|uniref:Uncharacterized protein n=1 Tax=Acanthosepion pharaonis TaxID=158019 RepID=A0A812CTQ1_ACAPH|nr:unnamed protein product [Sepia pharaonis]
MPKDRRVPTKNRDLETWLYSDPYESAVAVGNSTKRRKKSTSRVQPSPTTIPDLIPPPGPPPPVSCAKTDTIFAQNPFDDQPLSRGNMQNKQLMSHSQAVGGPPGHSGKVYPPNKSMVFNPANPNAPPIYPCGICHKEVHDSDQAILCESGCNFCHDEEPKTSPNNNTSNISAVVAYLNVFFVSHSYSHSHLTSPSHITIPFFFSFLSFFFFSPPFSFSPHPFLFLPTLFFFSPFPTFLPIPHFFHGYWLSLGVFTGTTPRTLLRSPLFLSPTHTSQSRNSSVYSPTD